MSSVRRTEEAQPQFAVEPFGCLDGSLDDLLDGLVGGCEVAVELPSQVGQCHAAGVPVEQGRADPALDLLDELGDAGRGEVEALGGAAEVQLVAQHEERLDLLALHAFTSSIHSR